MKTNTAPSVVPSSAAAVVSGFIPGLDLGDRSHHVCVLDASGQIVRETSLLNTRLAARGAASAPTPARSRAAEPGDIWQN